MATLRGRHALYAPPLNGDVAQRLSDAGTQSTAAAVATEDVTINGITYNFAGDAPVSTVSIGAAGAERTLTNVAAGRLSASSTDAVNGSQLFATNQAVDALGTRTNNLGTSVATAFGGNSSYDPETGTVTGGFSFGGNNYGSVQNVFDQMDGAINGGTGIKYFHANSTLADSQATGTDSVAVGPASTASGTGSIAMGNGAGATADNSVAIGNGASASEANSVALGSGSTTSAVVATTGTTINGTRYEFAGGAPVGTVSVGSEGGERTVSNVAAGRLSASSTDAVNGSQLYATNQAVENLNAGVGDLQEYAVQYDRNPDGSKANKVTLQGGDPNAPVVISNVGRGTADNDAVNVGQLNDGLKGTLDQSKSYTDDRTKWAVDTANSYTDNIAKTTLNQANAYTDQRLSQLNADIGDVRDEARQAAAIGLAAASLRFDDRPGKLSLSMGGGYWRSEGALALGAGYTSQDQRFRTNLMATTAGGNWGVGAGIGITLN
ncbi:hypothetical protein D7027_21550 [Ochrobactrum intermedium]|uniref:YadA-like family protein n=1 Tax=Brucella intermedia TaxID=94625 RepID=UPI00128BABD4|nr:hypothetical protein [Brucella intermedia]